MSEEHIQIFIKIVKENTKFNEKNNWMRIADECNKTFNTSVSSNAWRKRWSRLVPHLKKISENSVHDYCSYKDTLIDILKRPMSLSALEQKFKLSRYEILGLIKEINDEGLYQIIETPTGYQINKKIAVPKRIYQHSIGNMCTKTIMVISDPHMGSIFEQVEYLEFLYKEAKKRGITEVYNVGDMTDGHYTNRPIQLYALKCIGFDAQAQHVIDSYPYIEGITTYFILGNHDETHIRNGGANVGIAIARARPDMKYLGIGSARIMLTNNCSMDLLHPLDGSSYALSYSGQKYMDALTGGDKPNILLVGHHHKAMYMFYRNIHYYEVPSTCIQSDWEKRMRLNNTAGAWILNIEVDEEGSITSMRNELIPYYANKTKKAR